MKPAHLLTPENFARYRVWEYALDVLDLTPDETYVRPFELLPIDTVANRLVGTQMTFANGQQPFAILGNVDLLNPFSTEQFLTITLFRSDSHSFDLARYFDCDYSARCPVALAEFFNLPLDAIFPMTYDVSDIAIGHPDCLRRSVHPELSIKLSGKELIDLSLQ